VGSLARPIGAIVLGRFIDRHGRRSGLLVSVTLMVTASFGIALLPVYASMGPLAPLLLVVLRLVQGFGLGPELGGSATYLAESAPEGRRGLLASTYQSSVALGTLAVAGLISLAAALVGGFSPMVATYLATNRGLVAAGCLIAVMTVIAGAATVGMKETAHRSLREQ